MLRFQEMLVPEYKHTKEVWTAEIDALGGDSPSPENDWTREALFSEIEDIHWEKLLAQQGTSLSRLVFHYPFLTTTSTLVALESAEWTSQ
jgi:hypothetical protein